jgi:hypothetical protein
VLQACDHALCVILVRGKLNLHTHIGCDLCGFRVKPFERVQIVERDWVKSDSSLYEKINKLESLNGMDSERERTRRTPIAGHAMYRYAPPNCRYTPPGVVVRRVLIYVCIRFFPSQKSGRKKNEHLERRENRLFKGMIPDFSAFIVLFRDEPRVWVGDVEARGAASGPSANSGTNG